MKDKKICGIYCIENVINHKKYIGKSVNIICRWKEHKNRLYSGKSRNKYLQNSFNKYGEENFNFYIIEECEKEILSEREKYYIVLYSTRNPEFGYNLTDGGEGISGFEHSEETKSLISFYSTGRIPTEETRNKISSALKGNTNGSFAKWDEERKLSVSGSKNAWFGKHWSDEEKERMSKQAKGRAHSDDAKKKISESLLGEKHKDSISKYIGVCWNSNAKKWMARLFFENKNIYCGIFKFELEAALAYNEIAQEAYGWKAKLNNISVDDIESLWYIE